METLKFDKEITALLVIDPYNDFISEGGKIWDRLKAVAEANNCVPNMLQILNAAQKAGLRVFYALHHRYPSQHTSNMFTNGACITLTRADGGTHLLALAITPTPSSSDIT